MKLYKYCRYSEHLLGILAKNTIWLSSPEKFNDIFDCSFQQTQLSTSQLNELKSIDAYRGKDNGNIALPLLKKTIDEENTLEKLVANDYSTIGSFIKDFGIFSLSEVPDSLLLWAHYAQNHTGVCIEYETHENATDLHPVTYSTQYPTLSLYEFGVDISKAVNSILTTKSMEWTYEKEWRYLDMDNRDTEIPCPFNMTAIIFGARARLDQIRTIRAILNGKNISYKQAEQSKKRFSLDILDSKI